MSTKIYNAYIFDKVYSLHEIMQMFESVKKEMAQYVSVAKSRYVTREMVHLYDFVSFFEPEKVASMVEKHNKIDLKKLADYDMKQIWDFLANKPEETKMVKEILARYFDNKAYDDSQSNRRIDSCFDYNAEVTIIPMENKTLLMYFGNPDMRDFVTKMPCLSDYHYQNQTDQPASISDEEWEMRRRDWEKALGNDGVPSKHGMTIQLFNCAVDMFGMLEAPINEQDVPNFEDRAKWLMDYMDDYPNPPTGNSSIEWMRYLRNPEYLEWRKRTLESTQEKLMSIPAVYK